MAAATMAAQIPSLPLLNRMLDQVRSLEAQLASNVDHTSKVLKKMTKTGEWRKEWNRALSRDASLPRGDQKSTQLDLLAKIQGVRHEMASVRRENCGGGPQVINIRPLTSSCGCVMGR